MSANTNPRRWLAFDTSTDVLSLAVACGDQLWTQTLPGGAQASSGLIPAVLAMLAEADMPLASLDAIVFGRGPGSFTGLRTACAVAQGLAFGADLPVLPVDTLLAVAEEARFAQMQAGHIAPDADLTVLALLDARMDEVYSAAYRWQAQPLPTQGHWQEVSPLQVGAPEKIHSPQGAGVWLAGNAFAAYGERLPLGDRCVALPTAAALLRLAPALWAQGLAVPADQAMPLYIRDKVANTTAEREAMKAQAAAAKAVLQT
ncbi:MAG: tRNA (adenosine(37)-N6)-threonylcarbamoyltransferase complex dimerization subunit type 1 TsaB [Pseudomonadota bacterium]|jgi:tRNA threonylcarbamoyladenosine biosynthesis protein TsaB